MNKIEQGTNYVCFSVTRRYSYGMKEEVPDPMQKVTHPIDKAPSYGKSLLVLTN